MKRRIDEEAADHALAVLNNLRGSQWRDIYSELQDGATFVLFVVSVAGISSNEIDMVCEDTIVSEFNRLFSPVSTEMSWMVVFVENERVLTSYFG